MQADQPKADHEGAFIAFMLAFWPLLLIIGLIDHIVLPEYDLRLFALVLAGAVGWVCAGRSGGGPSGPWPGRTAVNRDCCGAAAGAGA